MSFILGRLLRANATIEELRHNNESNYYAALEWKGLAESRKSDIAHLDKTIGQLKTENKQLRERYRSEYIAFKTYYNSMDMIVGRLSSWIDDFTKIANFDEKKAHEIAQRHQSLMEKITRASTSDMLTPAGMRAIDREIEPFISKLRTDYLKSVRVFQDKDTIVITGDEYQQLIGTQRQLEETISIYEKTRSDYESAVKQANENVELYNALIEKYNKLARYFKQYRSDLEQASEASANELDKQAGEIEKLQGALRDLSPDGMKTGEPFVVIFQQDMVSECREKILLELKVFEFEICHELGGEYKKEIEQKDFSYLEKINTEIQQVLKQKPFVTHKEINTELSGFVEQIKESIKQYYIDTH